MNTSRNPVSLTFGGFLLIILLIGIYSFTQTTQLRHDLTLILGENIEGALEQIKNGAFFVLLGSEQEGNDLITRNELRFEKALRIELSNAAGPLGGKKAIELQRLYSQYRSTLDLIQDSAIGLDVKRQIYQNELLPLYQQIKNRADQILQTGQINGAAPYARSQNAVVSERQQTFYRFPPFALPLQTSR